MGVCPQFCPQTCHDVPTMSSDSKILAEKLFLEDGLSHAQIAERIGVAKKTVTRWSVDGQWVAKRDGIQAGTIKMLGIAERAENKVKQAIAEQIPERIDAISTLIELIRDLHSSVRVAENLRDQAIGAGAIAKLLQLYLDITPTTAAQYARLAAKDGITPEDFINALREEWGRTA